MNTGSEHGDIAQIYERMLSGDKSALSQLQQVDNKFSPLRKGSKNQPELKKELPKKIDVELTKAQKT